MSEEVTRREIYDRLHEGHELRFPVADYPAFYEWLNVPEGASDLTLVDIACGQGFFLEAAERCSDGRVALHGVDFSDTALDMALKRSPSSRLTKGSAYALPYADCCFDYCVNLGSLEHFDRPEAAAREMVRVLKPTGKALVVVPNEYYLGTIWRVFAYGDADDQGQEGITQFRTVNGWKRLFLAAGLDVTGVTGYNGVDHITWYFRRRDGVVTAQEKTWRTLLDVFLKPAIPLNLSHCFVFSLRRQPQ